MKLSIIISVYNSHKAVERQLKHFSKINMADIELIIADDGSNPPLNYPEYSFLSIYPTNSTLAWTQGLGRNLGASKAIGEYFLFTDIDHIITEEIIDFVRDFKGVFARFPRHLGILDENGDLKYDKESLRNYGARERYLKSDEPGTGVHMNTYVIRKDIFNEVGGYKKEWCDYGFHPVSKIGDDVLFDSAWRKYAKKHNLRGEMGPKVYVFPNGRFHRDGNLNPWGLFHDLSQKKQEKFFK